jgi:hypothetical protein
MSGNVGSTVVPARVRGSRGESGVELGEGEHRGAGRGWGRRALGEAGWLGKEGWGRRAGYIRHEPTEHV